MTTRARSIRLSVRRRLTPRRIARHRRRRAAADVDDAAADDLPVFIVEDGGLSWRDSEKPFAFCAARPGSAPSAAGEDSRPAYAASEETWLSCDSAW